MRRELKYCGLLFLRFLAFLLSIFIWQASGCDIASGSRSPIISGTVKLSSTEEPLEGIPVGIVPWEVGRRSLATELIKPYKVTRTDKNGSFSFYLTGNLRKSPSFLVFTYDEVYENQAYDGITFSGVYPTRKEIDGKAKPYYPNETEKVNFSLQPAVKVVDPVLIPMRDGAKLSAVMYMPKRDGKYPVILLRTPYGRHSNREYASIAREGYVIVSQDVRGRGESEGENLAFVNDAWGEIQDGYDTVEWLSNQPFSNGNVATAGGSALGILQELMAGAHPPHLKAQVIAVAVPSLYHYAVYPQGVYRKEQVDGWLEKHKFDPKNLSLMRQHPFYDEFWANLNLETRIEEVDEPSLLIGGWYDTFLEGTIASYKLRTKLAKRSASENTYLIIGPWTHGNIFSQFVGELKFPAEAGRTFFGEILSFLNYYLKGIESVFPNKAPKVQYYVMGDLSDPGQPGNFWMSASDFPPEVEIARLFLTGEGKLSPREPNEERSYSKVSFNPEEPVPTVGGRNLNIPAGPADQRQVEKRSDVILWTSDLLKEPLPIVGLVRASINLATEGKDADINVRLTDVYPDGTSFLILDESARLSMPPPYSKPRKIEPGTFYLIDVNLGHIAYIVNREHRLRIVISASNYPRFEVNKSASESGGLLNIFLSVGKDKPSYIDLPIYERVLEKFEELRGKKDE